MKTITEIIERSCTNKKSLSKEEADDIIDRKARRGQVMYYYKCEFCSRFHLTKLDHTVKSITIIGGNSN